MSTEPTEVDEPLAEDHGPFDWMSGELHALDQLMSRVGGHPSRVDELAIEVELETAREELRVADEEMRVQRDQLEELLEQRRVGATQRRRVASLLPVPMVTMDATGKIIEANAAAAAALNVPLVRLVGKPLLAFVRDADRGAVRTALSRVAGEPLRLEVGLSPRRSTGARVDLVLTGGTTDRPTEVEGMILTPARGADPGHAVDPVRLAASVTEISRLPVADPDPRRLLVGVARTTAAILGDGVWVSVNLGHPAQPSQLASTADEASAADGLQIRTGEGPCIDAFDEHETVRVEDLHREERWPRLRAAWGHCPVVAAMGVPVVAAGEKVGCLNCYSPMRGAFTRSQEQAAEVLALAAGVALEAVEENTRLRTVAAQLDQAMASRAVIDQAKGIVMARRGCTADEAFAHLAALSQQRNVKVRDLARALVEQTSSSASSVSRRRS